MTSTVTFRTGDLFATEAPAIGHGVNCAGLMGAGIAKAVAARYGPLMLTSYRTACRTGDLAPGGVQVWAGDPDRPLLLNIASQDRPGPNATLGLLDSGIRAAMKAVHDHGHDLLAIPRIGCGIGGLEWFDVQCVLAAATAASSVSLEVWTLP